MQNRLLGVLGALGLALLAALGAVGVLRWADPEGGFETMGETARQKRQDTLLNQRRGSLRRLFAHLPRARCPRRMTDLQAGDELALLAQEVWREPASGRLRARVRGLAPETVFAWLVPPVGQKSRWRPGGTAWPGGQGLSLTEPRGWVLLARVQPGPGEAVAMQDGAPVLTPLKALAWSATPDAYPDLCPVSRSKPENRQSTD